MWLKDKHHWTKTQIAQHQGLSRRKLKTVRLFRMKEALRDIFAEADSKAEASELLTAWLAWAKWSRLVSFRKLARTRGARWDGILNGFDSRLSNGGVEAINALIKAAKPRPRLSDDTKLHKHGLPRRRPAHASPRITLRHNILYDIYLDYDPPNQTIRFSSVTVSSTADHSDADPQNNQAQEYNQTHTIKHTNGHQNGITKEQGNDTAYQAQQCR